jgi:hypothetical protein
MLAMKRLFSSLGCSLLHVGRLRGGLSRATHHGSLHLRAHTRSHHASLIGSTRSSVVVLESTLELNTLNVLLVLDFLLHVLVALQKLVVLSLSQLEALVKVGFKLLFERVHLVLLSLDEFSLGSNDFLMSFLHVLLTLFSLKFLASDLNLMGLLILLLLGEVVLDLLLVKELSTVLESERQFLLEIVAV